MANEVGIRVTSDNDAAAGLKAAEKQAKAVGDEAVKAGAKARTFRDDLKGVGADGDRAAAQLVRMRGVLRGVDDGIRDAARSAHTLRLKIAETGDVSLFGDLAKQERELNKLLRLRKRLAERFADEASEAGGGWASTFVDKAGGVLMSMLPDKLAAANPAVLAVGGGIAVGVGTVLGAAIASAIAGGVGAGGIIGGFAIAARHPAIEQEAQNTGDVLQKMLERSAVAFVPAGVKGIRTFRGEILKIEDDLTAIFNSSSTFVEPLAKDAGAAVRELVSGLRPLVEEAAPAVDALGNGIVRFADAAGDGMSALADNTESSARALTLFMLAIEGGTRSLLFFLNALAEGYEWMEIVGSALRGDVEPAVRHFYETQAAGGNIAAESSERIREWLDEIENGGTAAETAARQVDLLTDAIERYSDQQINMNDAERAFDRAVREAKDGIDGKVKALNDGTEKGDEYGAMLDEIAQAARGSAQAILDNGGTQEQATAKWEEGRNKLIEVATQMLGNKEAAIAYADSVMGIPPSKKTVVTAETAEAEQRLQDIVEYLGMIKSKRFTITQVNRQISQGDYTGIATGQAHGGIVGGAAAGGIRSNLIEVGEYGREVVELPPGARVHSNPDTERMLSGGGGWPRSMVLGVEVAPGADQALMREIVKGLIFTIRTEGQNDPQTFLSAA